MTRTEALEAEHRALAAFLAATNTEREVEAWEALEAAHRGVHDHEMVRLASVRGVVVVTDKGKSRQARLVAWRPKRRGRRTNTARVEFAPNQRATVPLESIQRIEPRSA